ncbi:MAG: hypothetical protein LCH56_16585 [Proteobacteria bacterium]|nr:hypothetical protein [Pseudomonadota bacterium]
MRDKIARAVGAMVKISAVIGSINHVSTTIGAAVEVGQLLGAAQALSRQSDRLNADVEVIRRTVR